MKAMMKAIQVKRNRGDQGPILILGMVLGFLLGALFFYFALYEYMANSSSDQSTLRVHTIHAERHGKSFDWLVNEIRNDGIECTTEIKEVDKDEPIFDKNGNVVGKRILDVDGYEASIVLKPNIGLLGLGSRWIVHAKLDTKYNVERADLEVQPIGFF
jgi:hypothetical protein